MSISQNFYQRSKILPKNQSAALQNNDTLESKDPDQLKCDGFKRTGIRKDIFWVCLWQ